MRTENETRSKKCYAKVVDESKLNQKKFQNYFDTSTTSKWIGVIRTMMFFYSESWNTSEQFPVDNHNIDTSQERQQKILTGWTKAQLLRKKIWTLYKPNQQHTHHLSCESNKLFNYPLHVLWWILQCSVSLSALCFAFFLSASLLFFVVEMSMWHALVRYHFFHSFGWIMRQICTNPARNVCPSWRWNHMEHIRIKYCSC